MCSTPWASSSAWAGGPPASTSTARTLRTDDGDELAFDGLIVATGAAARPLPGTESLAAVRTLRTLDDCLAIRRTLLEAGEGARVVVIGAGFIGSEVAATCRTLGAEVTVVEALPTPLGRVLGDEMGEACAGLHRAEGVTVRAGVGVDRVSEAEEGAAAVVHLADGTDLPADVVVVGIGVVPAVEWLEGSGLTSRQRGGVRREVVRRRTGGGGRGRGPLDPSRAG